MRRLIDFTLQRERHHQTVGRDAVLARLHELTSPIDPLARDRGWILVQSGPGMGKSAILSHFLTQLEMASHDTHTGKAHWTSYARSDNTVRRIVPHHFIRRGADDLDRPDVIANSLTAQVEAIFPDQADASDFGRGSLSRLLVRVAAILSPEDRPLILVVDGLDEAASEPGARGLTANPLPHFLPDRLPRGVFLVCSSRPLYPHLSWLASRDDFELVDLDAPEWDDSNEAASRAFWDLHRDSFRPALTSHFIDAAVACGAKNLLYAVKLREWLAGQSPEARKPILLPRGLHAFIELMWSQLRQASGSLNEFVLDGLGVLAAAQDSLTLTELGRVTGWQGVEQGDEFLHAARPFLHEDPGQPGRRGGEPTYRPYHEFMRQAIERRLRTEAIRACHRKLAATIGIWPTSRTTDRFYRRYAIQHALRHRAEACDADAVRDLTSDVTYLEALCRESGTPALEAALRAAAELPNGVVLGDVGDIQHAVRGDSHWLQRDSAVLRSVLYNRLLCSGWDHARLAGVFGSRPSVPLLKHPVRLGGAELRTLVGHRRQISSVATCADGTRAISGSKDGTLTVWDVRSGLVLHTFTEPYIELTALAISADGTRAISGSGLGTLGVWDLIHGVQLRRLDGHAGPVRFVALNADGTRAVSGSADGSLKVWDLVHGVQLPELSRVHGRLTFIAISSNGALAVFGSGYGTIKVWDLANDIPLPSLAGHYGMLTSISISADGTRAVAGMIDGTIKVWDLANGALLHLLTGHRGSVDAVAISSNSARAVSGSADKTLRLWDLTSGVLLSTLAGHENAVTSVALSADGTLAVSGSLDCTLKVWGLFDAIPPRRFTGHEDSVTSVAISAHGTRAVSGSVDHTLNLWDPASGILLRTLAGHTDTVTSVAISADGTRAISGSHDKTLRVWDLASGVALHTLTEHDNLVHSVTISADGTRAVSGAHDNTLKVWDLINGVPLFTLSGHMKWLCTVAINAAGTRAVSGSDDETLKIWDLVVGTLLHTLAVEDDLISTVAMSSDGTCVVAGCRDGTLRVWDLVSGALPRIYSGHEDWIASVAISTDGTRAISGSGDRTLRIWDLASGACCSTVYGVATFFGVAICDDLIVAGDALGNVWVLDLPSVDQLDEGPTSDLSAEPPLRLVSHATRDIAVQHSPSVVIQSVDDSDPAATLLLGLAGLLPQSAPPPTRPFVFESPEAVTFALNTPLLGHDPTTLPLLVKLIRQSGRTTKTVTSITKSVRQILAYSLDALIKAPEGGDDPKVQRAYYRLVCLLALAAEGTSVPPSPSSVGKGILWPLYRKEQLQSRNPKPRKSPLPPLSDADAVYLKLIANIWALIGLPKSETLSSNTIYKGYKRAFEILHGTREKQPDESGSRARRERH